jgi:hypothetical protein
MKFFVALLLTALLSFAGALFFPWWIIALTAFIVAALIPQRSFLAFVAGFLALFLLWGVQASIIDANNHHVLSAKVAELLPLRGSYIALILVTALIGGLVGGMGALTGSLLRGRKQVHHTTV